MNKELEKTFGAHLRRQGMRVTPERKAILREVFALHRHFDADELCEILRSKKIRVSQASVYRTLSLLVEVKLVSRSVSYGGGAVYEHVYGHGHHDHMLCMKCGRRIEFSDKKLEKLQDEICRKYGFKPEYHNLVIDGLCGNCAKRSGDRFKPVPWRKK